MNPTRSIVATLCAIIFVIGMVGGVISIYTSRTLFNETMFANRVAESLSEPHISRVVSGEITDQIVAMRRDLTPFRPILLSVVERVVTSPPFRAMVKLAARKLHPTLITHGESLTLGIKDLGVILANALSMYPQIAEKLPARTQVVLGSTEELSVGNNLVRLIRFGHKMQRRGFIWPLAGILAGALGLVLTRRKDLYLLRTGLGLAIVALVIAAVARFGGYVAAGMTHSPTVSDLVAGLWLVFLAPLAIRMLVLAALGIILVAAVTTLLEKIDAAALARTLWGHAQRRPVRPEWLIARGLALTTVAIVIIFHPLVAVSVVAVAFASFVFFVGVQDIFVTAAQAAKRGHTGQAARKKGRSAVPALVASAVILLLAAGGAYWLWRGPEPEQASGPAVILACNGYSELRDRPLNQVVFPTTHNSMASGDISNWFMPNQEKGIRQQLEDGIRGLQIDVHNGVPMKGTIKTVLADESNAMAKYEAVLGKDGVNAAMRIRDRLVGKPDGPQDVYLGHGFCELGATRFVDALEEIKDFMILNPNEVLIFVIQDEGVTPAEVASCFERSGLIDFVYKGPVTGPWPTLGEMVARSERIVVLAENHAEGVPWYHHMIGVLQETPYAFKTPGDMTNVPNRGGREGTLLLMNNFIESVPPVPSKAEPVNAYAFLLKRARACRRERDMLPNLISVDFYRTGDLFQVCRAMNGIPEPAGPSIP
ncbi:MAG: hypothetical protein ACRENN_04100 [Candidatus Eiseniibacteriota bacterium]